MKLTIQQKNNIWILSGAMTHKDGYDYEAVCEFTPSEDMLTAIERIKEAHEVGAK